MYDVLCVGQRYIMLVKICCRLLVGNKEGEARRGEAKGLDWLIVKFVKGKKAVNVSKKALGLPSSLPFLSSA